MLKQALTLRNRFNQNISIDQLCLITGLVDKAAFASTAFAFWRHSQKQAFPLLADTAPNRLSNGVLGEAGKVSSAPALFHHIKQRLTAEQAQLYATVVGSNDGRLLDIPLLQLSDKQTWYTNTESNQSVKSPSRRAELTYALAWVEKDNKFNSCVHWVEDHTSQLWQQWQENAMNVISVVAPATRCWYLNESTTPASIVKQLDFYALNHTKMPLPYKHIAGLKRTEQSFWYSQVPIQLHGRGGKVIDLKLYALKLIDSKNLTELKTYYAFSLLNQNTNVSPEQIAVWLLQHNESKNILRYMGRAYHHKTLQNFIKQHQLDRKMALELAGLLGGAAWELDQYLDLMPVNQLLLGLSGKNALTPSQITSSLLKLFSLKQQIIY